MVAGDPLIGPPGVIAFWLGQRRGICREELPDERTGADAVALCR